MQTCIVCTRGFLHRAPIGVAGFASLRAVLEPAMIWLALGIGSAAVIYFAVQMMKRRLEREATYDPELDGPRLVDVELEELLELDRDEAAERIETIVAKNVDAARRMDEITPATGISLFPAPTWREGEGGRIERSMTLLPALFRSHYYGGKVSKRLRSKQIRGLVADAVTAESAGELLPLLEEMAAIYEGDIDEAPIIEDDGRYVNGDRPLSLLLADAARCLTGGANTNELRARYGLKDDPAALTSLDGKLQALASRETKAYMSTMGLEL